jgi:hypothetical protein
MLLSLYVSELLSPRLAGLYIRHLTKFSTLLVRIAEDGCSDCAAVNYLHLALNRIFIGRDQGQS